MTTGTIPGVERRTDHAVYEPVLRDVHSSARLSEMESQVIATMQTPGWAVLNDLWDALEQGLTGKLMDRSGVPSHEEYIQAHAEVRGLRYARQAPHALSKTAVQRREQAERREAHA